MNIWVRLLTIAAGYLLACTTAVTVALLGEAWRTSGMGYPLPSVVDFVIPIVFVTADVAELAILPALLLIVLSEGFAWRSNIVYGVLGGALGLVLLYGKYVYDVLTNREPMVIGPELNVVIAVSGIVGGLVYWLVAGRNAGAWQRRQSEPQIVR
jgi:hypothetical protein